MTDEDMQQIRRAILDRALPNVPFDGWTPGVIVQAATAAGYEPSMAARAFPDGAGELVSFWMAEADQAMLAALADPAARALRLRERVAAAVKFRLDAVAGHAEAVRRGLSLLALPANAPRGIEGLYRTVDAIWHGVGDRSTDFSYYTKRASLAAIYSATVLYWLDDASDGKSQTWAFLDRRIDNLLAFQRWRGRIEERLAKLPLGLVGQAFKRTPG